MAPPVRPAGSDRPIDPVVSAIPGDPSPQNLPPSGPTRVLPLPPDTRMAPTADRLGSGILDSRKVETAKRVIGDRAPPSVPARDEKPLSVSVTVDELAARLEAEEAERASVLASQTATAQVPATTAKPFDNRERELKLARTLAELQQEHPEIYEANASGRNIYHFLRGRFSAFDLEKNIRVLMIAGLRPRFVVEVAGRVYDFDFAGRPGTPIGVYATEAFREHDPGMVVIPGHIFMAAGLLSNPDGYFAAAKGFQKFTLTAYVKQQEGEYGEGLKPFNDRKPRSEIAAENGAMVRAVLSHGTFIFEYHGGERLTAANYLAALKWQLERLSHDPAGLLGVDLMIRLPEETKVQRSEYVKGIEELFSSKGYRKGVKLPFGIIGEEEERPLPPKPVAPPARPFVMARPVPTSSPPALQGARATDEVDADGDEATDVASGGPERDDVLFDDVDKVMREEEEDSDDVDGLKGKAVVVKNEEGAEEEGPTRAAPDDDDLPDDEVLPTDEPMIRAPLSARGGGAVTTKGPAARRKVPAVNPRGGFYVSDQREIESAALPVFERLMRERSIAKAHVVAHHLATALHAQFLSYVTDEPDAKRTAIFFDSLATPERHKHRFYGNVSASLLAKRSDAVTDQATDARDTLKNAMRDFLKGNYKDSAIILSSLSSEGRFLSPECQALHLWLIDSLYLIHELAQAGEGDDPFRLEWMLAVRLQTLSKGDLVNALYGRNQARAPSSKSIALLASQLVHRTVAGLFTMGQFPNPVFDWQNFFMGHGRLLDAFSPAGDLETEPHRLMAQYWIIRFGLTDAAAKNPADSFFTKGHLDRLDELIPQLAKLPKTLFSAVELKDARDFKTEVAKWMGKRTGRVALFGKKEPGKVSVSGVVFTGRTFDPFMRGGDHDLPHADSGGAERSYWEIIAARGDVERKRPVAAGHGPHKRSMDHRPEGIPGARTWTEALEMRRGIRLVAGAEKPATVQLVSSGNADDSQQDLLAHQKHRRTKPSHNDGQNVRGALPFVHSSSAVRSPILLPLK